MAKVQRIPYSSLTLAVKSGCKRILACRKSVERPKAAQDYQTKRKKERIVE